MVFTSKYLSTKNEYELANIYWKEGSGCYGEIETCNWRVLAHMTFAKKPLPSLKIHTHTSTLQ